MAWSVKHKKKRELQVSPLLKKGRVHILYIRSEIKIFPKEEMEVNSLFLIIKVTLEHCISKSKGGAVVRALASHQCGPGSNSGVDAICGLSFLLVLSFALRGFSPGTPVFPFPQKPILPNSNSIWNSWTLLNERAQVKRKKKRLNEFVWTPMCFVGKQTSQVTF